MLLQHLTPTARNAYNGISFSPERRGDSIVTEYSAELSADIEEIKRIAAKFDQDPTEQIARYSANYERGLTNWLHSKSRCVSSMIAGPSKFPSARMQKYNTWEDNKYQVFREWRRKAIKAIEKSFQPAVTVESELQRYQKELQSLERLHEIMKVANVIIRKAKGKDCTAELVAIGLSETNARKIQMPDWCGRVGFQTFKLTNNNANIKRVKERIATMEEKQTNIETGAVNEFEFEAGKIVFNHEEDRLQILYKDKPGEELRTELKRNGFKFSYRFTAWQRQLTDNAKIAARRVTGCKELI